MYSLGLLVGLVAWAQKKTGTDFYKKCLGVALITGLAVLSSSAPLLWCAASSVCQRRYAAVTPATIEHPVDVDFGGHLRLLGYAVAQKAIPARRTVRLDFILGGRNADGHRSCHLHSCPGRRRMPLSPSAMPSLAVVFSPPRHLTRGAVGGKITRLRSRPLRIHLIN